MSVNVLQAGARSVLPIRAHDLRGIHHRSSNV
jgi:hypothetical protein